MNYMNKLMKNASNLVESENADSKMFSFINRFKKTKWAKTNYGGLEHADISEDSVFSLIKRLM